MIWSITSSRWTRTLAASRSPASRAWVAPAMPSPTRAKTWAKSRSTSWGTGMVGHSGCSMTKGPTTGGVEASGVVGASEPAHVATDPKRHPVPRYRFAGGSVPARAGGSTRSVTHPAVTVAPWSLGVLIGLVVGLASGLLWHLVRQSGVQRAATDGRGPAGRRPGGVGGAGGATPLGDGAAAGRGARRHVPCPPRSSGLLKRSDGRNAGPRRGRAPAAGREPSPSSRPRRCRRTTSSSWRWPRPSSARRRRRPRVTSPSDSRPSPSSSGPLSETLARYEAGLQKIEVERKGAYEGLSEKVAQLHLGHEQLQKETRQPGHRPALAPDAGPVGGGAAAAGGRDGRDARRTATSTSRSRPTPMTVACDPT